MVTRRDTKVSRNVEWSFECSETTGDVRTEDARTNDESAAHRVGERSTTSEDVKRFVSDGGYESESERIASDGGVDERGSQFGAGASPPTPESGETPGSKTKLDAETVRARWYVQVGGPVETAPTVRDGSVYVGTENGFVCDIDHRTA
ncbi:PQQ-binding-like beta-propeller repeat protein [Haladaptatus sp. DFWS20]|uniref:PQQ-binding-like beta-propeller repeat protein n=1 Tax=Haladaptatus sp. DFWS20 TaxID=3403467 RepID=UPI003EBE6698